MIDTHTARLAQMVEAAHGKPDIAAALVAAGFTAAEITDNLFEVAERLSGLETLHRWQEADDDAWARAMQKDTNEGDLYA
jgi:hypothetical protein